jgi:hypothetical protein
VRRGGLVDWRLRRCQSHEGASDTGISGAVLVCAEPEYGRRQPRSTALRRTVDVLHRFTYCPLSHLLRSIYGVAVCQLDPEPLKSIIVERWNRGHRYLVPEASDGSVWLLVAASALNDGNVVGDARRWTREPGRPFFIKRSNEAFEMPAPDSFVLPDGRGDRSPLRSRQAAEFHVPGPVHVEDAAAELHSRLNSLRQRRRQPMPLPMPRRVRGDANAGCSWKRPMPGIYKSQPRLSCCALDV